MTCVRELVAPYHIDVVDADPSPALHSEIVVTGDDSTVLGITGAEGYAPFACMGKDNAIVFTFATGASAGSGRQDVRSMCQYIVWGMLQIAHVEPMFSCPQIGGQLDGCGDKGIIDEAAQCGTAEPQNCSCTSGTTQNPHGKMLARFGAACP